MPNQQKSNSFFLGFPELSFITSLLQSSMGEDFKRTELDASIDFEKLFRQSIWHGVASRILEELKKHHIQLPSKLETQWSQYCQQGVATSLSQTAELIHLAKRLESHAIPFLPLKGPALAFQLENGVNYRISGDLDIIINPSDIVQVAQILKKEGYLQIIPEQELTPKQHDFFIRHHKHFCFFHPLKKILVECHWKWISNPYLFTMSFEQAYARRKTQNIFGHPFPILSNEDNYLYLATHAACHAWYRLFWLVDLLLLAPKIKDWKALHERARKYNIEQPFLQALALLERLFEFRVPDCPSFQKKINKLVDLARISMTGVTGIGPKRNLSHWIIEKRHLFMLQDQMKYKCHILFGELGMSPKDWACLPLPDSLFFLYYPLRPFLWAKRWLFRENGS